MAVVVVVEGDAGAEASDLRTVKTGDLKMACLPMDVKHLLRTSGSGNMMVIIFLRILAN